MTLAAQGQSYVEIARRLHLAPCTVRDYLAGVRRRLGAFNTTHAVAIALMAGLIELDAPRFLNEAAANMAANQG